MKKVLLTGCAGFIGYHLASYLMEKGYYIVGVDNLNDYYSVLLKNKRCQLLVAQNDSYATNRYEFVEGDLADSDFIKGVFAEHGFTYVIHLAAQAGVRYSIVNPAAYVDSNLTGFMNILECCRHGSLQHFIFASSSSVYGNSNAEKFRVEDKTDLPVSLYAATKKSNEVLAHSYSHLYQIPTTGLRFFTVYGPWGRPDMAYYKFTEAILKGMEIEVFNHGDMIRDFTYIDDVVSSIASLLPKAPQAPEVNHQFRVAPFSLYNIGNDNPISLRRFISAIESASGLKANEKLLPMQLGDVFSTSADVTGLKSLVGFSPSTSIEDGINKFVAWYREFHASNYI